MNTHATIELLFDLVFSMRSSSYKILSTRQLVVGGDEKGTQCLGYNWATLFLGDINTGSWSSTWGSLETETVKCGHESCGTLTSEWLRWRGPAAVVNDRFILSWERMLRKDYNRKGSVEKNTGRGSQNIVTCYATEDTLRIINPFIYKILARNYNYSQLFSYAVLSLHSLQTLLRP
jgi:hypothetical protein